MQGLTVSRRKLVTSLGLLAIAAPILQACSSGSSGSAPAAQPTTASNTSSSSSSAKAAPTPTTSTQSSSKAQPAQTASTSGKYKITLAVYAGANRDWMPRFAKQWAQQNPNAELSIAQIPYGNMDTKSVAEFTSGTMQDVLFSGCKWLPYNIVKGMFLTIDDFVKQKDPGMSDFIPATVTESKWNGKLYGLPFEFNTGNINIIYYNKDMLAAKGVKEPTDEWTTEDFTSIATKMTDASKGIWGTDIMPGTYYDMGTYARSYGGAVLSLPNFDKFTLTTDPNTVAATQWMVDLRAKHKAAPNRADSQNVGVLFPSQRVAMTGSCICSFTSVTQEVAKKFKWGVVLGPTGPKGLRGFDSFASIWNIYSKTKVPQQAYGLMMALTSKEAATWAVHNDDQPPARVSVWKDPQLNKDNNIFERVANWVSDGKDQGPFPIPSNLRYSELQDKWANLSPALFYGEVDFQKGMQSIQQQCEAIVQEPRA